MACDALEIHFYENIRFLVLIKRPFLKKNTFQWKKTMATWKFV